MAASSGEDDKPSLLFLLVDSLAFLIRRIGHFLTLVLPICGIAAGLNWALNTQRAFFEWRGHWGWDFLFLMIYALLLDRWIKESLLDDATDCDEVENLRRSIVSLRFLGFAVLLYANAAIFSVLPLVVPTILCIGIVALLALVLPSYSAAEPLDFNQALQMSRPVRGSLIVLIAGVALLSLAGEAGTHKALYYLPIKPWAKPAMEAAHRFVDCMLVAIAGHVLASLFRRLSDWHQPEPDDHPYRDLVRARRKVPPR